MTPITRVFNEWTNFLEDKQLNVGPGDISAFNYPEATIPSAVISLTPDVFHHVAYVYDGAEDRLYVDGSLVFSQAHTGDVGDSDGQGYIGGLPRDGSSCNGSFVGYLDSLRISDVARYAGASFTPAHPHLSWRPRRHTGLGAGSPRS